MSNNDGVMRPRTAVEMSANAAVLWRRQYKHWHDDDKFANGTTKTSTNDALNLAGSPPDEIARILNSGWAYPACGCRGRRTHVVAQFSDGWSSDHTNICFKCVSRASELPSQFPNACDEIDEAA